MRDYLPERAQAQDAIFGIYRNSHTPSAGARHWTVYMEYFNTTAPDGLNFGIEAFL